MYNNNNNRNGYGYRGNNGGNGYGNRGRNGGNGYGNRGYNGANNKDEIQVKSSIFKKFILENDTICYPTKGGDLIPLVIKSRWEDFAYDNEYAVYDQELSRDEDIYTTVDGIAVYGDDGTFAGILDKQTRVRLEAEKHFDRVSRTGYGQQGGYDDNNDDYYNRGGSKLRGKGRGRGRGRGDNKPREKYSPSKAPLKFKLVDGDRDNTRLNFGLEMEYADRAKAAGRPWITYQLVGFQKGNHRVPQFPDYYQMLEKPIPEWAVKAYPERVNWDIDKICPNDTYEFEPDRVSLTLIKQNDPEYFLKTYGDFDPTLLDRNGKFTPWGAYKDGRKLELPIYSSQQAEEQAMKISNPQGTLKIESGNQIADNPYGFGKPDVVVTRDGATLDMTAIEKAALAEYDAYEEEHYGQKPQHAQQQQQQQQQPQEYQAPSDGLLVPARYRNNNNTSNNNSNNNYEVLSPSFVKPQTSTSSDDEIVSVYRAKSGRLSKTPEQFNTDMGKETPHHESDAVFGQTHNIVKMKRSEFNEQSKRNFGSTTTGLAPVDKPEDDEVSSKPNTRERMAKEDHETLIEIIKKQREDFKNMERKMEKLIQQRIDKILIGVGEDIVGLVEKIVLPKVNEYIEDTEFGIDYSKFSDSEIGEEIKDMRDTIETLNDTIYSFVDILEEHGISFNQGTKKQNGENEKVPAKFDLGTVISKASENQKLEINVGNLVNTQQPATEAKTPEVKTAEADTSNDNAPIKPIGDSEKKTEPLFQVVKIGNDDGEEVYGIRCKDDNERMALDVISAQVETKFCVEVMEQVVFREYVPKDFADSGIELNDVSRKGGNYELKVKQYIIDCLDVVERKIGGNDIKTRFDNLGDIDLERFMGISQMPQIDLKEAPYSEGYIGTYLRNQTTVVIEEEELGERLSNHPEGEPYVMVEEDKYFLESLKAVKTPYPVYFVYQDRKRQVLITEDNQMIFKDIS